MVSVTNRALVDARIQVKLDSFDREIVQFVLAWAPYGGPPREEVLPRFGMLDHELDERLHHIVFRGLRQRLVPSDYALLQRALSVIDRADVGAVRPRRCAND